MALTLRSVKGSQLTWDELDANFTGLANGSNMAGVFAPPGDVTAGGNMSGANLSGTNTGDQDLSVTLSGDVTGTGTGSITTTVADGVITYAKIQDVTDERLLGRSAGSDGPVQELTVGTGLTLVAGVLANSQSGGSTTFLGLTDTPSSFVAQKSKFVAVKQDESAVEFVSGLSTLSGVVSGSFATADPMTWTASVLPSSSGWTDILWAGDRFIAVLDTAGAATAYSFDGKTWLTNGVLNAGYGAITVAFNGTLLVALRSNFHQVSVSSDKGASWVNNSNGPNAGFVDRASLTSNWPDGSLFVSPSGANSGVVHSSPDGSAWTNRTMPATATWAGIAYGGGRFVAVAGNATGNGNASAYSTNGTAWSAGGNLPSSSQWRNVFWTGRGFFAHNDLGTNAAFSTDGTSWVSRTMPISPVGCGAADVTKGRIVIPPVLDGNIGYYSDDDGATWTATTFSAARRWTSVAHNGQRFASVAYNGSNSATYSLGGVYVSGTLVLADLGYFSGLVSAGSLRVNGAAVLNATGAALTTTATSGFTYIPTCAGAPTGVPTLHTGTVPLVLDTTNFRLYYYRAGAWHYIGETA